jgi:quercetin dioxygenase-like cupin family protein
MTPPVTPARKLAWAELPVDRPMPLIERQRIIGDHLMVSRVTLAKGFTIASHHHANEQFVVMLSGRCTFGVGAEGGKTAETTFTFS